MTSLFSSVCWGKSKMFISSVNACSESHTRDNTFFAQLKYSGSSEVCQHPRAIQPSELPSRSFLLQLSFDTFWSALLVFPSDMMILKAVDYLLVMGSTTACALLPEDYPNQEW